MKLFVIGEKSPNADDWSIWSEFSLVTADSEEQARELWEIDKSRAITEVDFTKPQFLCSMPEPAWGDDL